MNKYEDFIPKNEKGVTIKKGIFLNTPSELAHEIYFYPLFGGEYKVSYPYKISRNFMDSFLIMYIKSGSINFKFREKEFCAKNQVVLLDCKELNYYSVNEESEFYFLHFNSPFMQKIFNYITESNLPIFSPYKNIENLFIRIFRLIATNSDGKNDPYLSNLTYSLISDLLITDQTNLTNYSSDFHTVPDYITSSIKYIDHHYQQKVTVKDVAINCSISPSQLSRDFKKYTGSSIHNYLLNVRIKKAESMLVKDLTISIEKIAVICGFTDASHLYKKIKESTGMSPGQFRKKYY